MSQKPIFSKREEEVITLLLEGKSNKQIALELGIAVRTVEFHLGNIYSKLQVSSRSEAILQLIQKPLQKPTGKRKSQRLWQTTVDNKAQTLENERNFRTTGRFLVKRRSWGRGLIAIAVIVIVAFVFGVLIKPSENQSPSANQRDQSFRDQPTTSPGDQIIREAQQLVAEYDQAIKNEMQKGELEIEKDPDSGKERIRFKGDSYVTVVKRYEDLNIQLQMLNERYLALYIADVQPTPFPTQSTQEENDDYYQELLSHYPEYFDQLLVDGPTVMIYDPDDGIYYQRVIGDTYAKSEIMADAMETLRQAPQMAKIDQEAHMALIREILGNPAMPLTFQGIQGLANAPWINAALYTDEGGATYGVAIDAGCLATIDPGLTSRVDVPAVDVKSMDDVRPIAEEFASVSSFRFDEMKNELLYEEGSKGDIYFFRWDARNKDWSGTSWEKMPPFLQIGMSADGELVTYINTLDTYP